VEGVKLGLYGREQMNAQKMYLGCSWKIGSHIRIARSEDEAAKMKVYGAQIKVYGAQMKGYGSQMKGYGSQMT
jgi:hypothetical protein